MVLGTLIALLLAQLGGFMRLLITTGLVLVWSMPPVVAVNIWNWMVDYEFGVRELDAWRSWARLLRPPRRNT